MSPEQSEGRGAEIGPASDVYSLGATLYCIVTGRPALSDNNVENMLVRLRRGAIDPPRHVNHRVPAALEAIVMKAMALRPADRYPSAQAWARISSAGWPTSRCRRGANRSGSGRGAGCDATGRPWPRSPRP